MRLMRDSAVKLTSSQTIVEKEIGAYLLGQIGTPLTPCKDLSIPILELLITNPDPEVRSVTAESLGRICHEEMPIKIHLISYVN